LDPGNQHVEKHEFFVSPINRNIEVEESEKLKFEN